MGQQAGQMVLLNIRYHFWFFHCPKLINKLSYCTPKFDAINHFDLYKLQSQFIQHVYTIINFVSSVSSVVIFSFFLHTFLVLLWQLKAVQVSVCPQHQSLFLLICQSSQWLHSYLFGSYTSGQALRLNPGLRRRSLMYFSTYIQRLVFVYFVYAIYLLIYSFHLLFSAASTINGYWICFGSRRR